MQDKDKYALVIAGASGVGKSTVASFLLKKFDKFSLSRSATTRSKRVDGKEDEYYYFTDAEFKNAVLQGEFVEYTDYGENSYGTLKCELQRIISQDKHPLLVLDLKGVASLREIDLGYPVYIVYLYEELDVIRERLYNRDVKGNEEVGVKSCRKRMENNVEDYKLLPRISHLFNVFIRAETVDLAMAEIISLTEGRSPSSEYNLGVARMLAKSAESYTIN